MNQKFLKFLTVVLAMMLVVGNLSAQSKLSSVSGTVIDAREKEPLLGATVTVKGTSKGSVTDDAGVFNIVNLKRGETVTFEVNFLGYKTQEFEYTPKKEKSVLEEKIYLKPDNMNLDEVVVQGSAPTAMQLGDTTQFNSGAYKTNPDATAEDLVAKMPGFDTSSGQVEVAGETVSQVYVDGKAFFKDDPMTALNTLSADMVESIQVFDEQSDKSRFTGIDDGNRTKTINIVTKAKKTSVRMGDIIVGYGTDSRYNAKGNLNIFEGDHRFTIGFGINNINQSALSGGRFYGRSGSTGIKDAAGAKLNYSGEFKKDADHYTSLAVNYTFDRNYNRVNSSSVQEGIFIDEVYTTDEINNSLSIKNSFRLDLETTQGNNQIYFRPYGSYTHSGSDVINQTLRNSDGIVTNDASTETNSNGDSYNVGGSATWFHKLNARNSVSVGGTLSMSRSESDKFLKGNSASYDMTMDELVDSLINQQTLIATGTNSVEGSLSYTYALTPTKGINFEYKLGYDWSDSDNKTYLYNEQTGMYEDIYESLSNVFERDYITQNGGVGYSANKKDVYTFSARLFYQYASLENNLVYPENKMFDYNFSSFDANTRFEYSISKSKRLTASYTGRPVLPTVSQLQDVLNTDDPLKVTKGNPYLTQGFSNALMFSYASSNMEKSTTFRLFSRINNSINSFSNNVEQISQDTVINGVSVQSGAQLTTPVNVDGYWNVHSGFFYSFPLEFISSKMNTGMFYSYSRQPSVMDGIVNYSKSNSVNFNAMVNSNISENVDFSVGDRFGYTRSTSTREGVAANEYYTNKLDVRFNWIFLNNFVFNTDYSYNYNFYSSNSISDPQYHILNVGLGYKFLNKNAELRLSAYDLLDQCKNYSHSVGDIYITDTVSEVLQRYFMLTLSFKFNNMKGKKLPDGISTGEERRGPGSGGGPGGGGPPM